MNCWTRAWALGYIYRRIRGETLQNWGRAHHRRSVALALWSILGAVSCAPKDVSLQRQPFSSATSAYNFKAQDLSLKHTIYLQYRLKDALESLAPFIGRPRLGDSLVGAGDCRKPELLALGTQSAHYQLVSQSCEIQARIPDQFGPSGRKIRVTFNGIEEVLRYGSTVDESLADSVQVQGVHLRWEGTEASSEARFELLEKKRFASAQRLVGTSDPRYRIVVQLEAEESQYFKQGEVSIDSDARRHSVQISADATWLNGQWQDIEVKILNLKRSVSGLIVKRGRRRSEREEARFFANVELGLQSLKEKNAPPSLLLAGSNNSCEMPQGELAVINEKGVSVVLRAKPDRVPQSVASIGLTGRRDRIVSERPGTVKWVREVPGVVIRARNKFVPWYHCVLSAQQVKKPPSWRAGELPMLAPVWTLFWE